MTVRTWGAAALAVSLLMTACGGDEDVTETEDTAEEGGTETDEGEDGGDDRDDWPDELVLGLVPSREAGTLIEDAEPLAVALEEALEIEEVEAIVPQDYTGLTEAMGTGQADIGAFGPLGIVRAQERAGVEFILQSERFGSLTYHTQYMTTDPDTYCMDEVEEDDEGLKYCNGTLDADEGPVGDEAIAEIGEGTTLAYVDPTSTSGYLIPALQMLEAGIDLDAIDSDFAGGHDSSVLQVNDGQFDVGLSFDDARLEVIEDTPDVVDNVVVFAYSQEIPNDGFVVRSDLPDSLKEAIVEAMLDYADTDEGVEVLQSIYNIDDIVEADQGALDVVRQADEELGDTLEEEG